MVLIVAKPGALRDSLQALMVTMAQTGNVVETEDYLVALRMDSAARPDLILLEADILDSKLRQVLVQLSKTYPHSQIIILVKNTYQQQQAEATRIGVVLYSGVPASKFVEIVEELLRDR